MLTKQLRLNEFDRPAKPPRSVVMRAGMPRERLVTTVGAALLLFFANCVSAGDPSTLNGLPFRLPPGIFYPPTFRRLGISGRVVLAYSVNKDGRAEKIVVLVSDDPRLEGSAVDLLRKCSFDVPKSWEGDRGSWRRLHLEVTFAFKGDPPLPRLADDGEIITITATLIKPRSARP